MSDVKLVWALTLTTVMMASASKASREMWQFTPGATQPRSTVSMEETTGAPTLSSVTPR